MAKVNSWLTIWDKVGCSKHVLASVVLSRLPRAVELTELVELVPKQQLIAISTVPGAIHLQGYSATT